VAKRKKILYGVVSVCLFISGCNDSSKSTQATPTPALEQVTPSASSSTPLPSKAAPAVLQPSDQIVGTTLEDQSFNVNFENFGESRFITTTETVDDKDRLHFYIQKDDAVTELSYELESPDSYYSASAVAFRDVNGDGKKDIIVIADYMTGIGYMGAIPISQLIIFKQTESGFMEDRETRDKALAGVPYRILTVQDVMTGLQTDPEDSVAKAWQRLLPGDYVMEGSNDLVSSTLTIHKFSDAGLSFSLDAWYASSQEAMEQGGVNIGTIESGIASPIGEELIFKDGDFELSFSLISNHDLYVRANGEAYFGHNVYVNGSYSRK